MKKKNKIKKHRERERGGEQREKHFKVVAEERKKETHKNIKTVI